MKKKAMALITASAMALSLTACGGGGTRWPPWNNSGDYGCSGSAGGDYSSAGRGRQYGGACGRRQRSGILVHVGGYGASGSGDPGSS